MALTDAIQNTSQHSANILRACLTGAAMNSKNDGERKTLASVALAVDTPAFDDVRIERKPRPRFEEGDE